jgi:hypothetical protein
VLPSTVLGLLFAVAALGPGFVYVRRAERRTPRAQLSTLGEFVEMLALGAGTTLVALLLCAALNDLVDWVSVSALARDAGTAVADHTIRWLAAAAVVLAVSYGIAFGAAALATMRKADVHVPSTGWVRAFTDDRPDDEATLVTAELRDGRLITGLVWRYTTQFDEDRELVLRGPLVERASRGGVARRSNQTFLVLRERDIVWVEGHYVARAAGEA